VGFLCLVAGAATVDLPFLGCIGIPLLFVGALMLLVDDFRANDAPAGTPRGQASRALGLVGGVLLCGLCAQLGHTTATSLLALRRETQVQALGLAVPALYLAGLAMLLGGRLLRVSQDKKTILWFALAPWATAVLSYLASTVWPLSA
jgi:hypothetical protein